MEDPYELPSATPARRRGHVVPLFWAMGLLLMATLGGTFWVWRLGVNNGAAMRAEQGCLSSLQTTLDTLKDAETGQRGFILTGNQVYLQPYDAAVQRLPENMSELKSWVDAGELRREDFDFIANTTERKLDEMKAAIDVRRAQGLDAAVATMRTDADKKTMDELRSRIASMSAQLQAEIENRAVFRDSVRAYDMAAFAITTVLNLGFLVWALGRVLAEMHDREAAALDVLQQKVLLSVTLSSIGDAVIVTDPQGQ